MSLKSSRRGFFGLAALGLAGALGRLFGGNGGERLPSADLRRTNRGRITAITDPLNHTTVYSYDARGRVVSETNPLNGTMVYTYSYDAKGRRVDGPVCSHWYEFDTTRFKKLEGRELDVSTYSI